MIICSHNSSKNKVIAKSCKELWQVALQNAIRNPKILLKKLGLTDSFQISSQAIEQFPICVPYSFLNRIKKNDPQDPLLLQILPLPTEMVNFPGFHKDPLQEKNYNHRIGLLHKYRNRVLIFPSTQCGINCRYCFRRHFPYTNNRPNQKQWHDILNYIRNRHEINEVILSGGDPLVVNDNRLSWLINQIAMISHINTLRIHSRMPVVIPERITDSLLACLTDSRLKIVMMIHCNHANEINDDVGMQLNKMRQAGILLFNQSVLLRGINDSVTALHDMGKKLFDYGVIPYYLHLLDRVQGTAHFEVEEQVAQKLIGRLATTCSGYLVPRLVREKAGMDAKIIMQPYYH